MAGVVSSIGSSTKSVINEAFRGKEPWQIVAMTSATVLTTVWLYNLIFDDEVGFCTRIKKTALRLVRMLPAVRNKISNEIKKLDEGFENHMKEVMKNMPYTLALPEKGMSHDEIIEYVKRCVYLGEYDWENGRVSGCIYKTYQHQREATITEVFKLTSFTNPLHADIFPGICKLEAEIVRITCKLFNGDDNCCGTMTSGGTESILMAVKAYRDFAREVKGIKRPEIVLPVTAHAAFDKAAQYLRIRIRAIPVNPETYTVDVDAMKKAISRNTIMLVASLPNFPYGTMDDVEAVSKLGELYNIPVHVDACLGGFLICFMNKAGYRLPKFDFRLPGVTSISADTHKYGYTPKGTSVILYRNKNFRHYQFVITTDWPGGIYASPTVNGSRAGSSIATCWATLMSFGEEEYVKATQKIVQTRIYIEEELRKIEGIQVLGKPITSLIAFNSDKFHIYTLSQALNKRGWSLNPLQYPNAVHICVTLPMTVQGIANNFIKDVQEETLELLKRPPEPIHGMYAVYGMSQNIADRNIVEDVTKCWLDSLYYTPREEERIKEEDDDPVTPVTTSTNDSSNKLTSASISSDC